MARGWDGGVSLGPLIAFFVEHPLEFQAPCAEVEEQTGLQIRCLEVVSGLRQMGVRQFGSCFQFNADNAFHQDINSPQTYLSPLVVYGHLMLTAAAHTGIHQFYLQRSLIDEFLEAIAQRGMYGHRTTDDLPGKRIMSTYFVSHVQN